MFGEFFLSLSGLGPCTAIYKYLLTFSLLDLYLDLTVLKRHIFPHLIQTLLQSKTLMIFPFFFSPPVSARPDARLARLTHAINIAVH